ncbi:MAG: hypothetical protein ABF449_09765 [Ethanoligenens sp.]|uniref:hypothetical protein n=1 Tax=Ethanoligenens sp. TaxID=2099655 RepID=UPI0039EA152C
MAALYEFLNRRDTYANWQNNNVVLPEGVLGVITDSPEDELWLLMGDGQTHVKDLKVWVVSQKYAPFSQLTLHMDGRNPPFKIAGQDEGAYYVLVAPNGDVTFNYSHVTVNGHFCGPAPWASYEGCAVGDQVFAQTLGKPLWWDGSKWVDATGAAVTWDGGGVG